MSAATLCQKSVAATVERLRHWIAQGQPLVDDISDKAYFRRDIEDLIQAAAWNRRTHPPQPDALPGDLRERVKKLIKDWPFHTEEQDRADELADAILSLIQSERGGA